MGRPSRQGKIEKSIDGPEEDARKASQKEAIEEAIQVWASI